MEEFLDQLPKPQIEEVEEPVPRDTAEALKENAEASAVDAGTGDLPQGKMPLQRLHWRMRHWELCTLTVSIIKLTWLETTPIWHFIGPQGVSRSQWTSGEECTRASLWDYFLVAWGKGSTDSVHVFPKGTARFCKQSVPSQAV